MIADREMEDNPVLNMLVVNKYVRDNITRLRVMSCAVDDWQRELHEGSGVFCPCDVVEKICFMNNLNVLKIQIGGMYDAN